MDYLGRCASRDNLDIIIRYADRRPVDKSGSALAELYIGPDKSRALARALYNIGGSSLLRSDELSTAPDRAKAILACMATKREFSLFDDDFLLDQIKNRSEIYRKAFLTQMVKNFPKTRLRTILRRYVSENDHIFYNCIYWLDVGISAPAKCARALARQEQTARLGF